MFRVVSFYIIVKVDDWESRFSFPITLVSQCLSIILILFIQMFGVQHLLFLKVVISTISYF
jgi:hypothetical protein